MILGAKYKWFRFLKHPSTKSGKFPIIKDKRNLSKSFKKIQLEIRFSSRSKILNLTNFVKSIGIGPIKKKDKKSSILSKPENLLFIEENL